MVNIWSKFYYIICIIFGTVSGDIELNFPENAWKLYHMRKDTGAMISTKDFWTEPISTSQRNNSRKPNYKKSWRTFEKIIVHPKYINEPRSWEGKDQEIR